MAALHTIFALCLVASISHLACPTPLSERLEQAHVQVDKLTARVAELTEKLQELIEARENADQTASDLNIGLDAEFGNGCAGSWRSTFRCGQSPQCVPNILLCNGHEDCANGADEQNCEMRPIRPGDVYTGGCSVDTCDNDIMDDVDYNHNYDRWVFKSLSKKSWFPQQEVLRSEVFEPYNVIVDDIDSEYVSMSSHYQVGTGVYQSLYSYPSGGLLLHESCQALENGRVLKCEGWRASVYGGTGKPCYLCHYARQ